jgi:hypothetical protein
VPRLHSNIAFIASYRNQADLISKAGYCFVNLRSAVHFIECLDASMVKIDPGEFSAGLAAGEAEARRDADRAAFLARSALSQGHARRASSTN